MSEYKYKFNTNWKFEADIDHVWALISEFKYGDWWPGVSAEKIGNGGPDGIGDRYRSVFRTKLPYQLAFESEVISKTAPNSLEIKASGELEGRGTWKLTQENQIVHVQYVWEVNTNKKWMNALAPILRPAFVWNHDQVMDAGAKGLASAIGAPLISH